MKTILISRTDSIGDVMLTLPLLGWLKEMLPECRVIFLCAAYTQAVVRSCEYVDDVLNWSELQLLPEDEQVRHVQELSIDAVLHVFPRTAIANLMKKANIPLRVGTRNRLYHWRTCNKLIALSRKNSPLHEAELNLRLAEPFAPSAPFPALGVLHRYYGFTRFSELPEHLSAILDPKRFNLILHPKSQGSAPEWSEAGYKRLLTLLPAEHCNIILTGTEAEGKHVSGLCESVRKRGGYDLTGQTTLEELIALIARADGLLASSTGPLHIAAALGKHTLGLFAPIRPMHPARWKPLGVKASVLSREKKCNACQGGKPCGCIDSITPEEVAAVVVSWLESEQ